VGPAAREPCFRLAPGLYPGGEFPGPHHHSTGVVHGYRNLSDRPGLVCNFANRLYRGPGRQEPVDEIRFEDTPDSPFRLK